VEEKCINKDVDSSNLFPNLQKHQLAVARSHLAHQNPQNQDPSLLDETRFI